MCTAALGLAHGGGVCVCAGVLFTVGLQASDAALPMMYMPDCLEVRLKGSDTRGHACVCLHKHIYAHAI